MKKHNPTVLTDAVTIVRKTALPIVAAALFFTLPGMNAEAAKEKSAKAKAEIKKEEPKAEKHEGIVFIENPLRVVNARFLPSQVGPGATTELTLDMNLPDHHKAYLERFKIKAVTPETLKVADPKFSPVVQFMDTFSKKMKDGVEKDSVMKVTVEIPGDISVGEHEAEFALTYQACTKEACGFPTTIPVKATFEVTAGAALAGAGAAAPAGGETVAAATTAALAADAAPAAEQSELEKAMSKSLFSAFLLVFLGGILTSLTPCVYPMIPITLAVIGARAKGQTRAKSFTLSVIYVLGIATTYSLLGVVAASTGAMFGSALGNIYVVTAIALLFTAMGLSMYGLFEIQAPAFIRDKLGSKQTGSGYFGAYMTGAISGVVASPCIGPVLVTILAWIAQTKNSMLGMGLLFSFAMGMGILLIVLGTFSHLLNKVPKGGSWMEVVKFTFGTAMVGMALYYVAPVYPDWLYHALLAVALILIASAYGAFESNEGLSGAGRMRKGAMIVTFVIGLVFALSATFDRAGIKLPTGAAVAAADGGATSSTKLAWQPYSDAAVEEAAKSGKPVLVDFYADWCAACKELEHLTFPDTRVRDLSEKFTLLKIDATEDSAEVQRLKQKYGVIGLPTMIFYDTNGRVRKELTVTGFENADKFSGRMRSALGTQTASN